MSKTGAGKWILGGQNTYTGDTLIQEGTLLINGSTAAGSIARLSQGATLGGGGTIYGAVEAAGEVMPGNGFGVLSVGSIAFGSTSSLSIQLGRDGDALRNGRLASSGAISLTDGTDLRLTLATGLENANQGDIFFLLTTTGGSAVSGTFTHLNGVATDLQDGSTFHWNSLDWVISYGADFGSGAMIGGYDVAIQAVPEPGSLALGAAGAGLALAWMRRRNGSRIGTSV